MVELPVAGTSNDANGRVDLRLGEDANGELYLLTKRDGEIFRLSGSVPEPDSWLLLLAGLVTAVGLDPTGVLPGGPYQALPLFSS